MLGLFCSPNCCETARFCTSCALLRAGISGTSSFLFTVLKGGGRTASARANPEISIFPSGGVGALASPGLGGSSLIPFNVTGASGAVVVRWTPGLGRTRVGFDAGTGTTASMDSEDGRGLCLREGDRANFASRPEGEGSLGGGSGASVALAIGHAGSTSTVSMPIVPCS